MEECSDCGGGPLVINDIAIIDGKITATDVSCKQCDYRWEI